MPNMLWRSEVKLLSHVRLFATPWTVAYQAPLSTDFPSNSTGVDCHFLLQGLFPTQGLNPHLPHCRQTLYRLSHQGVTGKSGLGVQNEAGQRLTEFCQENTLVIANTLFQQHRRLCTRTSTNGQYQNQIDYILCNLR